MNVSAMKDKVAKACLHIDKGRHDDKYPFFCKQEAVYLICEEDCMKCLGVRYLSMMLMHLHQLLCASVCGFCEWFMFTTQAPTYPALPFPKLALKWARALLAQIYELVTASSLLFKEAFIINQIE